MIWNNLFTIAAVIVLWMISKSKAAKQLAETISATSEKRKETIDEKEAELARLKVELKFTTRELRTAREFNDEDRALIRRLENRSERYEREINGHRIFRNLPLLLAGSEDDEQHRTEA
jgi:hypothetical protein